VRTILARRAGAIAVLVALAAVAPVRVMAQTNERLYENVDFRFDTPGARALGMGRAFVGLADDATAALSNPAGLSNLLGQQFSLEFRGTQRERQLTPAPGVTDAQSFGQFVFTPSFMSYALPFERATLLLYRNSQQKFQESFEFGPRQVPTRDAPEDGAFGAISAVVENFGAGGAFVVNGKLSVGGSANLVTLDLASEARSGTRLNPRNGSNTIATSYRWSGTAGLLFKPIRGVAIGGTYAHRATFPVQTRLFGRYLWTQTDPEGTIVLTGEARDIDYVVPTRYAVGGSWRASDTFTVAADVSRVLYSQRITDKFLVVDFVDPAARLSANNFSVRDVTQWHAGAEYRFYLLRTTVAVRGGFYTEPNHPLRFVRGGNNPQHPADALLDFRFNRLPDQTRLAKTGGVGMALANRVQLDGAISLLPGQTQFVASLVFRVN
jgi:long-chain fatty acid transport protein